VIGLTDVSEVEFRRNFG